MVHSIITIADRVNPSAKDHKEYALGKKTAKIVLYAWPELKYSVSVFGSPLTFEDPTIFVQPSDRKDKMKLRWRRSEYVAAGDDLRHCA